MGTSARPARDAWLLPTLEGLLSPEQFAQLRSTPEASFWEAAVRRNLIRDDDILAALSARLRAPPRAARPLAQ